MSDERDPLEERLRAAMAASADDVTPRGDGLTNIRKHIAAKQTASLWYRFRTQWLAKPAFAAVSSVGVIAIGLTAAVGVGQVSAGQAPFGIGGDKSSSPAVTSTPTKTSPSSSKTTDEEPTHSDTSTTPTQTKTQRPPETVTVPVYNIVKGSSGYQLSQSSQQVTVKGSKQNRQEERAEGALQAIYDAGSGLERSGAGVWPAGTQLEDADLVGSTVKVMLSSAAGTAGNDSSAEAARAALKQVVYTALGATPTATTVQIYVGGTQISTFWGKLSVNSAGMQRGDPALTQPFNTVNAPSEGTTNLSPVTIKGHGAYDDSQANWEISRNGQVVNSGSVGTGTTAFTSWSHRVQLDPGTYQLTTYEQSDGTRQHVQTVTFTVSE
ncbi:MAG: hypothetical protein GEV07_19330 [Streptosporangiales bacterium]|nr:hypothetical protein [Streptosporangiales bacterium]